MSRPVEDRLREVVPPDAADARERARAVLLAAQAKRAPALRPDRRRARALAPVAAALALGLGAAAVAATPPGDGLRSWVRDVLGAQSAPPRPAPALDALPAAGRLLVTSRGGAWVVHADGSRRRLGPYTAATWSPHGLFVAAIRGRQLVALEPGGVVRWILAARAPVRDARWAPSGFRVAYRSGGALRVVAGDGSGDHLVVRRVAPVAPAWRPAGPRNELTYVARTGDVLWVDADSGKVLARIPAPAVPGRILGLEWSASGRRLLVTATRGAQVLTPAGRPVRRVAAPGAAAVTAAALAPDGRRVAVVAATAAGRRAVLVAGPGRRARTLFAASGAADSVTWSPDGRVVLVPWGAADQWLFLGTVPGARTTAVADVAMQFDVGRAHPTGVPAIEGWCCD